ncbi:hypothetical protein Y032_0005g2416 [Ancylostoma ceylanicum]|uniref:SCP domain-containing protein n=1 Tax=Ancylostoma ceylanicum TaxID=53326 RepID=A0A016VTK4_9BILA|nr:hypothetical protein Y032_0005g2416 [Ancylostoma ceylanicum]
MAKLSFIALAIASLLPALCEATAFCATGQLTETQINDYVINPVNRRRDTLAAGNQKNGESGANLPPAQGMTQIKWNCDLEKRAIDALAPGCYTHDNAPTSPDGKAQIFDAYYTSRITGDVTALRDFIDLQLGTIDYQALPGVNPTDSTVKYVGDATDSLLPYFTLVQPAATEIGCAWKACTITSSPLVDLYCVLNSQQIKEGDVIYNVATATTPPVSGEASFPSGASTRCSHALASKMTDNLRTQYENLHNFRRGLLATGQIPRKDGKYLPKSSNMRRIEYNCDLELGAIEYAGQCPTTHSELSSRPNFGENFKTFPATRFATFEEAAKKSVTEWWKPIRDVNYFENNAVFRPFHDGAPISSFTQVSGMN